MELQWKLWNIFRTGSSTGYPHQSATSLANGAFFDILLITMLSNYYTLAAVANDLAARLRGRALAEAYSQERNELVLSYEGIPGGIVITCTPEVNTLYSHPSFSRARANSADVLKTAVARITRSVGIQSMDRVVSFSFDGNLTMYAQFFGSKANVLVVDSEHRIVDAFKDARVLVGTSYTPPKGELLHDVGAIRLLIGQQPEATLFTLLKRAFPVLGTTLTTEILVRSGLGLSHIARDADEVQIARLEQSFMNVLAELSHPSPRVYLDTDPPHVPHRFSIVKLEQCAGFDERLFVDIHEAIRYFVSRVRSSKAVTSHAGDVIASLQQHRTKLKRTITAVEEDLKNTSRADEYDRFATLLVSNLDRIQKGMKSITLADEGVTIPLDAKLSPVQNMQRYYEKAKKSKAAFGQSHERLQELRATLSLAEQLLATVDMVRTKDDLKLFMAEHSKDLEGFGIGKKAEERQQLPFRIFIVDGGFEVWAGKSSRNNDELTMKYARPADLWFHARGASGSHVILRNNTGKGDPGKKAKEQAASIAAYYSKMRNAKMVPVAMTERKYVRKPKGASPGTVTLEREKVIFAEPALPKN